MSSKKVIVLISSDEEAFEVEEVVASQSLLLKQLIEDGCIGTRIPIKKVKSKILSEVIKYCKKHAEKPTSNDLKSFNAQFVNANLLEIIMAADYLNIPSLLDLTFQTVADMIEGKTPEEIRKVFNIENDFTPEQEVKFRINFPWAFK